MWHSTSSMKPQWTEMVPILGSIFGPKKSKSFNPNVNESSQTFFSRQGLFQTGNRLPEGKPQNIDLLSANMPSNCLQNLHLLPMNLCGSSLKNLEKINKAFVCKCGFWVFFSLRFMSCLLPTTRRHTWTEARWGSNLLQDDLSICGCIPNRWFTWSTHCYCSMK